MDLSKQSCRSEISSYRLSRTEMIVCELALTCSFCRQDIPLGVEVIGRELVTYSAFGYYHAVEEVQQLLEL